MKRLLVLVFLCLLWIPAAALLRDGRSIYNPVGDWERVLAQTSRETVLSSGRESLFLLTENHNRAGNPVMYGQFGNDVHANPERLRVLVLGDSFTFGHGAYDLDMLWWRRMEEELVRRVGDGVFEIVTIAQNGASLVTQAGWLREVVTGDFQTLSAFPGASREELQQQFAEPFDVVVLGFVGNDIIIDSGGSFVSNDEIESYAGLDIIDITLGLAENPNEALVNDAISYIASQFPAIPKMVLSFNAAAEDMDLYKNSPPFDDYGFTIAANPETARVLEEVAVEDQMVSPVDPHPSALLTRAFAVDAANALLDTLGPAVERAAELGGAVERPLVSGALPASVAAEGSTNGRWVVSLDGVTPPPCYPLMGGTTILRWGIECSPTGSTTFVVDGDALAPQFLPCLALGRPHVAVFLDRLLPAGSEVQVTLSESSAPGLSLHTVGYSAAEKLVVSDASFLKVGDSYALTASKAVSGFLLSASPQGSCSADAAMNEFPSFTVVVDPNP